jgi:uncharacterized protein YyaL (SSP411 family)
MVKPRTRRLICLFTFLITFCVGNKVHATNGDPKETANRLVMEKSPYLLQHARNPVDWYPWGEEAFKRAQREDKPIFLSIGYATCHWCHVMAHESFEDEEVAGLLNRHFVSIKVDREERPDVDKIYMFVCQSLTGHGGWPLSVFMTPEGKPFFAGTYFPKLRRMGMPGFVDVLNQIATMWQKDRGSILKSSEAITAAIQPSSEATDTAPPLTVDTLNKGYTQLARVFDPTWGGFGTAPKFPTPHNLTFLLRWHRRNGESMALDMVEKGLEAMRRGGIFDQIGLGFHRYSVDKKWFVPHFEKMLYDQALLAMAYTEAYQATGRLEFAEVAKEIFIYVLRDMTSPDGGFYSAEDADSEGKEGLFYLWTPHEVKEHLGKEAGDLFCRFYDITETGNFEEGRSIPHMPVSYEAFAAREGMAPKRLKEILEDGRKRLFEIRNTRIRPLKDDKVLTSWNGLMIAALAKGYQVLGDQAYARAAQDAVAFLLKNLKTADGRLLRRYREGEAAYSAYLDDYAFLVWGLLELYEATFDISCLENALTLNDGMLDLFWDHEAGGLYFTGEGNEPLIALTKELYDGALPSGNSVAALNLLRLGRMTGNPALEERAEQLVQAFSKKVLEQPMAYTQFLLALDFMVGPSKEIVVAGDPALETTQAMVRAIQKAFMPNKVLLLRPQGEDGKRLTTLSSFVEAMLPMDNEPTVYMCEKYACQRPLKNMDQLQSFLH